MFERFTDRARRVVVLAHEEARMLNHDYVGPEHILLGLIRKGGGVAAQVLARLGADLNRVRQPASIAGPGRTCCWPTTTAAGKRGARAVFAAAGCL
jgi:ATP-dependent Clp protease ATP-binding subunit ClpC